MSWAWTRTFYARKDGEIYNFEAKRNRDDAVMTLGLVPMNAADAYKSRSDIQRIEWREYEQWKVTYGTEQIRHDP